MQNRQQINKMRNNYSRVEKERVSLFDCFNIFKYVVITIFFALISYGVKKVVMLGISSSPTGQVGNQYLTLYEVHNTGAAFNLFAGQQEMIIFASLIAVGVIAFAMIVTSSKQSASAISAMSALSAGIIMNLIERVQLGYVVDYIHCNFAPNIPVFNVPDIFIVVGAVGLILSVLTRR